MLSILTMFFILMLFFNGVLGKGGINGKDGYKYTCTRIICINDIDNYSSRMENYIDTNNICFVSI